MPTPRSYGPQALPHKTRILEPGAPIGTQGLPVLPLSMASLPDIFGVVYGDGFQRMRHVVRSQTFPTGLIPPKEYSIPAGVGGAPGASPVIPGGNIEPVLTWDPAGEGIRATGSGRYLFLSKGGLSSHDTVFYLNIVDTLTAAGPVWQIRRQPSTLETVRVMVDAINGVTSAEWVAPNTSDPLYSSDGMAEIAAEEVGGALVITWTGHPIMGHPTPDLTTAEGGNGDLLRLHSTLLASELLQPGGVAIYEPTVYGRTDEDSSEPSKAYLEMWLDDEANWNTGGTGVVSVADAADQSNARAYFVIQFVQTFTAPDHTWQVDLNGITPDRSDVLEPIQQILAGTYGTNPLIQAPDPNNAAYKAQLGIGDIVFRARGNWGGLFYRDSPGASGNAAWLYQTIGPNAGGNDPIPPAATFTQFHGGGDGYDSSGGPSDMPGAGNYGYGWAWYREIDKARSGMGVRYQLEGHGGGPIGVIGWPSPEDPGVDFHRLFRTLLDGLGDYFKVDDVLIASPQGEYVDERSDMEIAGFYGSLLYNQRQYRTRAAGYPEKHRFLARHQSAIWGGGLSRSAPTTGLCNWTNGSDVVVIDPPIIPTRLWVGRYIRHPDFTKRYAIIEVDESNGHVQIGEDYEEEDAVAANFTCEDERAGYSTYKAETNFHNQWPARPLEGTDGIHKDGITGLLARQQAIYVWTRSATWVVTGSASGGQAIEPISASVGLLNQRCMVIHEGVAYYLSGPAGVYAFDFAGPPQRISNPPFMELGDPRGIQGTIDRINWDASEWFHAVLDPDNRLVRWFVAIDGSEYPNYVVTLDLKSRSWGEDDCPPITSSSAILLPSGGWAVLSGDAEGRIWMHDVGDSDGAFDVEPNQTVLSATSQSVTFAAAINDAIAGAGVLIVNAEGTKFQRAWISYHKTDTVSFREELEWVPQAGDLVVLGAIDQWIEPNRFDAGVKDEEKMVPVVWVHTRIESRGEYYFWVWDDEKKAYVEPLFDSPVGDLTRPEGTERIRTNMRGHELGFRIRCFEPGFRPAFRRFELQMVVRGKPTQGT